MNITLENHPSQARDEETDEPLFDAAGKPVPLFRDQRSIVVDGKIQAYLVLATGDVQFVRAKDEELAQYIAAEGRKLAGLPQDKGRISIPLSPGVIDSMLEAARKADKE